MDILFFITTLITGVFLGIILLGSIFVYILHQDSKTLTRRQKTVEVVPGVHTASDHRHTHPID